MKAAGMGILSLVAVLTAGTAGAAGSDAAKRTLERGRYLAVIGGCNDCHTAGYPERAGAVPVSDWLTGNAVGFQGPWGTAYPGNLRLLAQSLTEAQWKARARSPMRPPMPWFNLKTMNDADLGAIYQFIRSLGAKGQLAPAYVPPGKPVHAPYIEFVPKKVPQAASAKR